MDSALVKFFGSGLAAVAAGRGQAVPQGAIAGGYSLVQWLGRGPHKAQMVRLLEEAAIEIIREVRRGNVPDDVVEHHMDQLPSVLEVYRPLHTLTSVAVAVYASKAPSTLVAGSQSGSVRKLVADILNRAERSRTLARLNLNQAFCVFLIERLFVCLLSDRAFLEAAKPEIEAFCSRSLWLVDLNMLPVEALVGVAPETVVVAEAAREPAGETGSASLAELEGHAVAEPAVTAPASSANQSVTSEAAAEPAVVEAMPGENQSPAEPLDAESLGLQQNAFTALVLAFGRKGKDTSTADEEIKAAASNLTALAKALSARQEQDIKVTQHLSDAALWLTAGRFEETDMLLNRAVTLDINHAEWEPEQEALRLASAARTLAARGKLAELCNDLQAAVERFADARMVQPRADQAAMERYAALEATALAQIRQLTGMSEIDEITEVAAPAGAGGNRPPSRQDFRRHA